MLTHSTYVSASSQYSDEVNEDLILDFDAQGRVIGIEILDASEKADLEQLVIQAFEKVMVEQELVA